MDEPIKICGMEVDMSEDDQIILAKVKKHNEQMLTEARYRMDNDLDTDKKSILIEYPHKVMMQVIPGEEYLVRMRRLDEMIDWLSETLPKETYRREWLFMVYFKKKEDAALFKLTWG